MGGTGRIRLTDPSSSPVWISTPKSTGFDQEVQLWELIYGLVPQKPISTDSCSVTLLFLGVTKPCSGKSWRKQLSWWLLASSITFPCSSHSAPSQGSCNCTQDAQLLEFLAAGIPSLWLEGGLLVAGKCCSDSGTPEPTLAGIKHPLHLSSGPIVPSSPSVVFHHSIFLPGGKPLPATRPAAQSLYHPIRLPG